MKALSPMLLFAVCILALGQSRPTKADTPFQTRGAFFGVSVGDLQASAKWYEEKLGLKEVVHYPPKEKSDTMVLSGGGLMVELVHNDDAVPLKTAAPAVSRNYMVHGIFKSGLVVQDLDGTLTRLKTNAVEVAVPTFAAPEMGMRCFIIKDNAGNLIQFFGK